MLTRFENALGKITLASNVFKQLWENTCGIPHHPVIDGFIIQIFGTNFAMNSSDNSDNARNHLFCHPAIPDHFRDIGYVPGYAKQFRFFPLDEMLNGCFFQNHINDYGGIFRSNQACKHFQLQWLHKHHMLKADGLYRWSRTYKKDFHDFSLNT